MFNWLKRILGNKKEKGVCDCGGRLTKASSDIIETYGNPVMICSKCRKLVEI